MVSESVAYPENGQQQVSLRPTFYRSSRRLNSVSVSSQTPINPRELITTINRRNQGNVLFPNNGERSYMLKNRIKILSWLLS